MNRRALLIIVALTVLVFVLRFTTSSTAGSNFHPDEHVGSSSSVDNNEKPPSFAPQRVVEAVPDRVALSNVLKPRKNAQQQQQLMNGVILYLSGGRWESYFVQHALPRLDEYFVSCFPYPILVFHENAPEARKQEIRNAVPKGDASYRRLHRRPQQQQQQHQNQHIVRFDDVSDFWKHLPASVSEEQVQKWLKDPVQRKFQGRGYRVMCRFWAGGVWSRKSLDEFEFYWRLDTDSILTRPLLADPFRLVFVQRRCVYGFNRLKGENPHVAVGMFDAFKHFLGSSSDVAEAGFSQEEKAACLHWVTHRSDGVLDGKGGSKFWAPMYYNNFEMGTLELKRSTLYQAWFRWVDEQQPHGIFRYRWGDAPLHTLGILVAQRCSVKNFCNVTFSQVPYRHAVTRMPAMLPQHKCGGSGDDV